MTRSTGPACGNNPNHQMTPGDRQAVDNFRAYLERRAAARELLDCAVWVDGDPLMEAIAAAVWEHCDTSGGHSIVTDDPRNIAAVAATVARAEPAAVSAAVAPPTGRSAVLRWAADAIEKAADEHPDQYVPQGLYDAADRLRRMADECPECGDTGACNGGPCPLRRMADETATETPAVDQATVDRALDALRAGNHITARLLLESAMDPAAGARQDGAES